MKRDWIRDENNGPVSQERIWQQCKRRKNDNNNGESPVLLIHSAWPRGSLLLFINLWYFPFAFYASFPTQFESALLHLSTLDMDLKLNFWKGELGKGVFGVTALLMCLSVSAIHLIICLFNTYSKQLEFNSPMFTSLLTDLPRKLL